MEKFFSIDQICFVFTTLLSTLAAYFTPTKGFLFALIIMFGFNIWAVWMAYSFTWWLLVAVGALGVVFYILNKKFDRPVLFLEYWIFSYPYVILLINKIL